MVRNSMRHEPGLIFDETTQSETTSRRVSRSSEAFAVSTAIMAIGAIFIASLPENTGTSARTEQPAPDKAHMAATLEATTDQQNKAGVITTPVIAAASLEKPVLLGNPPSRKPGPSINTEAVSYTHLTLPTIYSV